MRALRSCLINVQLMYMECLRLSDIQRSFSLHIPHAFSAELCFCFVFYHACFLGGVRVVGVGVGVFG